MISKDQSWHLKVAGYSTNQWPSKILAAFQWNDLHKTLLSLLLPPPHVPIWCLDPSPGLTLIWLPCWTNYSIFSWILCSVMHFVQCYVLSLLTCLMNCLSDQVVGAGQECKYITSNPFRWQAIEYKLPAVTRSPVERLYHLSTLCEYLTSISHKHILTSRHLIIFTSGMNIICQCLHKVLLAPGTSQVARQIFRHAPTWALGQTTNFLVFTLCQSL